MTVSEAKALSERGDTKAMMALAEYYMQEEGDAASDMACHYYELAANAGELEAILKMAQTFNSMAAAAFSMIEEGNRLDSMDVDIEKAFYWAKKLDESVRSLNVSDSDTLTFAADNLILALSRVATLYYLDEKYDDMSRVTEDINHPYAQTMYGLALFKKSDEDDEVQRAFGLMKNIENDLCWKEEYQTKFGRILLIDAANYLSAMYRIINHDANSAYRVKAYIVSHSISESVRRDVKASMAKNFRKSLFGGYTYIGS